MSGAVSGGRGRCRGRFTFVTGLFTFVTGLFTFVTGLLPFVSGCLHLYSVGCRVSGAGVSNRAPPAPVKYYGGFPPSPLSLPAAHTPFGGALPAPPRPP